jgi:hypothetical protein
MEIFIFWLACCLGVAAIAKYRGRDPYGWFCLSVLITPVITVVILLLQRPMPGTRNQAAQLLFDSLPDDAKQRVMVAEAARVPVPNAVTTGATTAFKFFFGIWLAIIIFAALTLLVAGNG